MTRIILFLITNMSVMILFGSIVSILNCLFANNVMLVSIAGIFGVGGAFVSLLLSRFIALSAVNGIVINQASNDIEDWLLNMICKQSNQLNIVAPKLAIYKSIDMNAFATGSRRNSSVIAISSGLLENMNKESIEAVIAHEMSHIVSGDMITMTLLQGILNTFVIFLSRSLAGLIQYVMSFSSSSEDNGLEDNSNDFLKEHTNDSLVYIFIYVVLELFFGVIASIIVFWFSRYREFYADAGASKLVGRKKMICALKELKCSYTTNISDSIITFCIHRSPEEHSSDSVWNNLFMSHPSLENRIEALEKGTYIKTD